VPLTPSCVAVSRWAKQDCGPHLTPGLSTAGTRVQAEGVSRVRELARTLINRHRALAWLNVDRHAAGRAVIAHTKRGKMWSGTGQSAWRRLNGCGVSFNRAGPAKRRSESGIYMPTSRGAALELRKNRICQGLGGLRTEFQAAAGDGRLVLRGVARREPFCSSQGSPIQLQPMAVVAGKEHLPLLSGWRGSSARIAKTVFAAHLIAPTFRAKRQFVGVVLVIVAVQEAIAGASAAGGGAQALTIVPSAVACRGRAHA
jgi:hypothetical protein